MSREPVSNFRGRYDRMIERKEDQARGNVYRNKPIVDPIPHDNYVGVHPNLFDEARKEKQEKEEAQEEEECLRNTKNCITDAWKWAFPTKSNNTIQHDSEKKTKGGKKSRKSHNSKKSKKSKKSHTTKRSRR